MLSHFASVKNLLKLDLDKPSIDDTIFKLHYRVSFGLLTVFTILVTQRQYIGEHIKCISSAGVREEALNTYCFFSSTYTVTKHFNESLIALGHIPHPGVGPAVEPDETTHHAYYQWVPFVLFLQALSFYVPHYCWKKIEGGKMRALLSGLRVVFVTTEESTDKALMCDADFQKKIEVLENEFIPKKYHKWARMLVLCEVFNLVNLIIQVYLTDLFLDGNFMGIGPNVWNNPDWDSYLDPLDIIFPKVTKCLFYKYGPSGSLQNHDALCVMALNVIHEKIYTILWFWYAVLFIFTISGLFFRLVIFIVHSKSNRFNKFMFSFACPGKLNFSDIANVTKHYYFGDWLFLFFLAGNMNAFTFEKLFRKLAEKLDNNISDYDSNDDKKEPLPENDFTLEMPHEYDRQDLPSKTLLSKQSLA